MTRHLPPLFAAIIFALAIGHVATKAIANLADYQITQCGAC